MALAQAVFLLNDFSFLHRHSYSTFLIFILEQQVLKAEERGKNMVS